MATCQLKELTFKSRFLVGVIFARKVSELHALSADKELCIFHNDRVALHTNPAFVPKVNLTFHRSEELGLPSSVLIQNILKKVNGIA